MDRYNNVRLQLPDSSSHLYPSGHKRESGGGDGVISELPILSPWFWILPSQLCTRTVHYSQKQYKSRFNIDISVIVHLICVKEGEIDDTKIKGNLYQATALSLIKLSPGNCTIYFPKLISLISQLFPCSPPNHTATYTHLIQSTHHGPPQPINHQFVSTHRIVVRPHNVCWRFRWVPHYACQIDSGPGVDVHVRPTDDCRDRLHDGQVHQDADGRCRWHLTFVRARVRLLRIPHLQRPVLQLRIVHALEALIIAERRPANGEQMDVPVPNPWHRLVAQVVHATVQVGRFRHQRGHVSRCGYIEMRSRRRIRTALQQLLWRIVEGIWEILKLVIGCV